MKAAWLLAMSVAFVTAGCGSGQGNPAAEAPPSAQVENDQDSSIIQVDHPEQFAVVAAVEHDAAPELVVTGTVNPDISRTVPVISLASGRVVEIRARLGDTVKKGQILMRVQSSDVAGAYSDYQKAVADEQLASTQYDRAKDLYAHGATSLGDLQVAKDTEDKAKVDVATTEEHLRLIGSDPDHPSGIVNVYAPVSGVITDQQVTNAAGVQALSSTNPFTISDLSYVWVICDVYENNLPNVRLGDTADIRLDAYPDQLFHGTISNIGAVLDPSLRTAKVRIEVKNPGLMRLGMFVGATFHGQKKESHAAVPATAILHLHNNNWVFMVAGQGKFQRVQVTSGDTLPGNMQEVISGIKPGTRVVQDALAFENTVEQ